MADVPESGTQSKEGCTGFRHTKEKKERAGIRYTKEKDVPDSGT